MKLLTFSAVFLVATSAFSQITLTESDFGNNGDTVRMSTSNDLMLDFASTGADFFWDFSQLQPSTQYVKQYSPLAQAGFAAFLFGPTAPAQYEASYFTEATALPLDQIGQFLPININGFYSVTKIAPGAVTTVGSILGVEDNLIPVRADTIETRYPLPLTYGDSYSSVGYTNLDMQPFYNGAWIQHRDRTSEVDGFGQITTPYGTFEAIRIRHEIDEYDSLLLDFNGNSFWIPIPVPLTREYEWWTNGEKEPLLKIVTSDIAGNEVVTSVEYRDIYRGLDAGLSEASFDFTLGPNPANENATVRSEIPMDRIRILANDGKLLQEIMTNSQTTFELELDPSWSGMIWIEVSGEKSVVRRPLVLR